MLQKRFVLCALVGFILLSAILVNHHSVHAKDSGQGKLVYVIPVENEVQRGMLSFLKRTTEEAEDAGADEIIFEINTPGGEVDSAGDIATLVERLDTPTTAYVTNRALSAGSYIALNMDHIYMSPHATMGASGVINQDGTAADKKAQSAWFSAMKGAAEAKGRDPLYAKAMADPNVDLPEYDAPKGKFLTLDAKTAHKVDYSQGTIKNREQLLRERDLEDAKVVEARLSVSEELARFVTSSIVTPILLSIASIGLVVEVYTPGFGVAGTMGLISLVLFFYGHIVAGLAGYEAIALLIIGIILILAEFFFASGIIGIFGIASIVGSLFLSGVDVMHMAMNISIAIIVAIVVAVILFKTVDKKKGVFKYLISTDRYSTEEGYVSAENRVALIGCVGETVSPLRPAGTAVFDGERLDVVSEGNYIPTHERVKVVSVEGARVVVRKMKKEEIKEE